MHIKEILQHRKPGISFEVFPPKPGAPLQGIWDTLEAVRDLKPDFVSVTYGAGGSTKDATADIASGVRKMGLDSMAHLTGITHTREQIDGICDRLMEDDVYNVLAMRGDYPEDRSQMPSAPCFPHAADLIRHIRDRYGDKFTIAAAAYPEGHLECYSFELDMDNLKAKVDQGVDFLVTQLFFDNELFYRFMEKIRGMGIDVPVCAGIFPVLGAGQIKRILSLCGVAFPARFSRILARYSDHPEALAEAGIAYASEQIIDLLSWGVDGIHLYTMNRPETTRRIMNNIGAIRRNLTDRKSGD